MFNVYVLYLSYNGDFTFSKTYSSFNKAKNNIEKFLTNFYTQRGKKLEFVNKKELKTLKKTIKKTDKNVYIKRKQSEGNIYELNLSEGRVYDSYFLEKKGKIGISEFSVKVPSNYLSEEIESDSEEYEIVPLSKVTNYEHGTHIHFISELKSILSNRGSNKELEIPESSIDNSKMENFIEDLVNKKKELAHVTPPTPKLYFESGIKIKDLVNKKEELNHVTPPIPKLHVHDFGSLESS